MAKDPGAIVNHDDRAAMICALSALVVATGDFVAVGDNDGWIILPPRKFIQPRQWALLETNANEELAGSLHIESGADRGGWRQEGALVEP